jgi:predicted metal-dependent hydrolase
MTDSETICKVGEIEFTVVYSRRKTLGISVLPDAKVVVRVPYRTSGKTIDRIVSEKSAWIIKHSENFRNNQQTKPSVSFLNGSAHMFRGNALTLNIQRSARSHIKFNGSSIEMGIDKTGDENAVKKLLYKGYKNEAVVYLPVIMNKILEKHDEQMFKPTGLVIRSMKRRWGSCSNKGKITLSTELIKLDDIYIEYVVLHELCHLKHHNHGPKYYELLSELIPDWKKIRKEIKGFIS